ncbi:MAG: 50S ribosomal protein L29 [Nanoarchaeota archaeon]|nr:50S ribosomal protein L29 [Nanoarchaeota archaeon]MBU4123931.1 50S ribosomal protein L29 [Nanoarchaeota archaeon]
MAIIKKKQIKDLTDIDLVSRLKEFRLELVKDNAQISLGGAPSNPGRVRQLKKTVSRLLTERGRRK